MFAKRIIEDISHIDLDEVATKILIDAVNEIRKRERDKFIESLEHASAIVAKWPEWKQNALGSLRRRH